jgi:hypothetical protein
MPTAGPYRDRITLQRYDTVTNDWVTLDVEPVMFAAVESEGAEGYRIRIRYRHDLFGFQDTHPAICAVWSRGGEAEDRTLDVTDVIETDRGREVTLIASSRQIETVDLAGGARRTQAWLRPQI